MIAQDSTDPTGVRRDVTGTRADHTSVNRARSRKATAAIEMRLAHATWDEIALALGYPTARQAQVSTEKALEKALHERDREHLRKMAGARLERLNRATWGKAIDPNHPEQLAAVREARSNIDRFCKLFGLDAPTELVVHNPTMLEIEAWVTGMASRTIPRVIEADVIEGEVVESLPA